MGQAEQQHLDWLARSFGRPEYQPLNQSDLDVVRRVGEKVAKSPGTHLFKEGDVAQSAYLIERGEVEIYRGTGKSRRVVSRVRAGAVLGDVAMFEGSVHRSSARALAPVQAVELDRARLLPELAVHPAVYLRWLVSSLRQMEGTQQKVIRLMHKSVLAQVADLLLDEAGPGSLVNLSQTTIANLLGVSRQSVNEALSQLRKDNLVETGYRTVRIKDRDVLSEISDGK